MIFYFVKNVADILRIRKNKWDSTPMDGASVIIQKHN